MDTTKHSPLHWHEASIGAIGATFSTEPNKGGIYFRLDYPAPEMREHGQRVSQMIADAPGNQAEIARLRAENAELVKLAEECLPYDDEHTRPFSEWESDDLQEHAEAMERLARHILSRIESKEVTA